MKIVFAVFFLCINLFSFAATIEVINEFGELEQKEIGLLILPDDQVTDQSLDPGSYFRWTEKDYSLGIVSFDRSPTAFQASVGKVPVLDQGSYGTCVTFASTVAMDMSLNAGDAIDQQCSLQLAKELGNDLWNGAFYPSEIIDPLKKYGAVRQGKCTAQYPAPYFNVSTSLYKQLVDPSIYVSKVKYVYKDRMAAAEVKSALKRNHVVAIGFKLVANSYKESVQGFGVVVNGVKKAGGLWACFQPNSGVWSNFCGYSQAGHEVVITGYDDGQSLFKIRNSWGPGSGDSGEFYMSYEFFEAMRLDGTEIWAE